MNKIAKVFTLISIVFLVVSCSLSEEITFKKDGSLSYSYMLDASDLLKMVPDSVGQEIKPPKDSVFSFADLLKEKQDSINKLPLEDLNKLEALKVFNVKMHENMAEKEYTIQLTGDFKDTKALGKALSALSSMDFEKKKTVNRKADKQMNFLTHTDYNWNGKVFKRNYRNAEKTKQESDSLTEFSKMFTGGTFKVKYNFPEKIKKVNDSKATISQDRKSVIIEYQAADYLLSPEITNIEVELEK